MLDLYCTNKATLTRSVCVTPGISTHDIVVADCDIKPQYSTKKPRLIHQYNKADWEVIKEKTCEFTADFTSTIANYNVEENWSRFKGYVNAVINKHIPSKWTSVHRHLPWLTTELKRMCKK